MSTQHIAGDVPYITIEGVMKMDADEFAKFKQEHNDGLQKYKELLTEICDKLDELFEIKFVRAGSSHYSLFNIGNSHDRKTNKVYSDILHELFN